MGSEASRQIGSDRRGRGGEETETTPALSHASCTPRHPPHTPRVRHVSGAHARPRDVMERRWGRERGWV
eukprot:1042947-Rhodomonas_salina.4